MGRPKSQDKTFNQRVYTLVRRIPVGRVMSYGTVALMLNVPRGARAVGWALNALLQGTDVPWQRVVNANRRISPRREGGAEARQRELLESEGVAFEDGVIARHHMLYDELELIP